MRSPSTPIPAATVELVVQSVHRKTAQCHDLNTGQPVTFLGSRLLEIVPGEIAVVHPTKQWIYRRGLRISGSIESTRIDVKALGLTPLKLEPHGTWDPKDEFWGDPPYDEWAK